jgi:hypothetical protein
MCSDVSALRWSLRKFDTRNTPALSPGSTIVSELTSDSQRTQRQNNMEPGMVDERDQNVTDYLTLLTGQFLFPRLPTLLTCLPSSVCWGLPSSVFVVIRVTLALITLLVSISTGYRFFRVLFMTTQPPSTESKVSLLEPDRNFRGVDSMLDVFVKQLS